MVHASLAAILREIAQRVERDRAQQREALAELVALRAVLTAAKPRRERRRRANGHAARPTPRR